MQTSLRQAIDELDKQQIDIWTQHLTPEPKVLFHYTSAETAVKILQAKTLWASDISVVRDETEADYPFQVVQEVLAGNSSYLAAGILTVLGADSKAFDVGVDHFRYASCFCTSNDTKSQWNDYGDSGKGLAIGFDFQSFRTRLANQEFVVHRMLYNPTGQNQIIQRVVDLGDELIIRYQPSLTRQERSHLEAEIGYRVYQCMHRFKSKCFASENEWRISVVQVPEESDFIRKTCTDSNRAYVEVPFSLSDVVELCSAPGTRIAEATEFRAAIVARGGEPVAKAEHCLEYGQPKL